MPKNVVNGFAADSDYSAKKGRHNEARNKIVNSYTHRAAHIKVPRNLINRKLQKEANIITKQWNERMQIMVDKKRPVYFKNPDGIEMIYLLILTNNKLENNFNIVVGCNKLKENQMSFVAMKVSKCEKIIEPQLMKIYDASLKGLLMTKPNVLRGSMRNGLEEQYVCHGYRKNPLDSGFGEYTFNEGVSETIKYSISRGISKLVGEMEEKVMDEINRANFEVCAGYDDFLRMQDVFKWPSVYEWGIATQFALLKRYCSRVHTDADYFLTTLMVYNVEADPDEVLYYFCFPTYNLAIPIKSGDIIVFNPLVPHCATNPSRNTAMIYSCYVSKKTCNTVVANASV
jgi:hypothetical protein